MDLRFAALLLAVANPADEHANHPEPKLGSVSFQTTCSPAADPQVKQGLAWLHSFEYQRAEKSFSAAANADPTCGIAHWGVAMSYYHPLWAAPTPTEFAKGKAAQAKAREIGARSGREQRYIAALDAFYADAPDHKTRVLAFSAAMADLHRRLPADHEAAVLYALTLIAAGTLDDDPDFAREREAGTILNRVFAAIPDHPGVTHYLIHSFDYPPLADLALPAARRYARIAPASAHAQHMPSHIFIRLGLWTEAIDSNRAAKSAAQAWGKASGMAGAWDQQLHAMDYLAYSYLQTGEDGQASGVFDELQGLARLEQATPTNAYAITAIPARVTLERRQWTDAARLQLPAHLAAMPALAANRWAWSNINFARAVGAARIGDLTAARSEIAKLRELEQSLVVKPGEYDWRKQIAIQAQISEAWLAHAQGRGDEAVRLMRAAADLDDATEKHPVTPGAVLPAREQLGELLVDLRRPAEAMREYEASLKRAPKRLAGLYGAARAARLAGDRARAARYYNDLAALTKQSDGTRAEVKEARAFSVRAAAR